MARQVVLRVEGILGKADKMDVINSLRKYSGVLDVDVNQEAGEVMVQFDPDNIIEEDLKETIEAAGYKAGFLKKQDHSINN